MSFFLNPYEDDHSPLEDEDRSPCGCGDPRCQIDGNDATNVEVNGRWFAADCVGLCFFCGNVDDLRNVIRISGSWLAHEGCVKENATITEELYRALHADEKRDDCNEARR